MQIQPTGAFDWYASPLNKGPFIFRVLIARPGLPSLVSATVLDTVGPPPVYANCAQLNSHYPHGIGLPGAIDKTRSTRDKRDTLFLVHAQFYRANARLDRDHDGIACEQP